MHVKNIAFFPLRVIYEKGSKVSKRNLARSVSLLCDGGSRVLDVGCDDGSIAKMVMEFNPLVTVVGVDIQSYRPAKIEIKIYDGKKLPFADESFDVVMALDVLHHVKDMELLLREMRRVSKEYIIIKDHRKYGAFSNFIISLADYCANLPYGIKCAFNYLSLEEWEALFNKLALEVVEMPAKLDFGFWIIERHNLTFKLRKGAPFDRGKKLSSIL